MSAPDSFPEALRWIRINLPKREELSFLTVLALPQASRTGLVATIFSSREASPSFLLPEEQMVAKYEMTFLVFSVLPAPDSPVMRMDWLLPRVPTRAWSTLATTSPSSLL